MKAKRPRTKTRNKQREEPVDVWDWCRIVGHLLEGKPTELSGAVIRSAALHDAMDGDQEPLDDSIARIAIICVTLELLSMAVEGGEAIDAKKIGEAIADTAEQKTASIEHLCAAAALLHKSFSTRINCIIDEIRGAPWPQRRVELLSVVLDPKNRRFNGKAAADQCGAFIGWSVRELDHLVKPTAKNRNAAIARLLKIAGILTTRKNVRSIIAADRQRAK